LNGFSHTFFFFFSPLAPPRRALRPTLFFRPFSFGRYPPPVFLVPSLAVEHSAPFHDRSTNFSILVAGFVGPGFCFPLPQLPRRGEYLLVKCFSGIAPTSAFPSLPSSLHEIPSSLESCVQARILCASRQLVRLFALFPPTPLRVDLTFPPSGAILSPRLPLDLFLALDPSGPDC